MALVFKKGEFGSPARHRPASGRRPPRRNHHVWLEEMKTHLNCRERERELYVLVREMFEASEV